MKTSNVKKWIYCILWSITILYAMVHMVFHFEAIALYDCEPAYHYIIADVYFFFYIWIAVIGIVNFVVYLFRKNKSSLRTVLNILICIFSVNFFISLIGTMINSDLLSLFNLCRFFQYVSVILMLTENLSWVITELKSVSYDILRKKFLKMQYQISAVLPVLWALCYGCTWLAFPENDIGFFTKCIIAIYAAFTVHMFMQFCLCCVIHHTVHKRKLLGRMFITFYIFLICMLLISMLMLYVQSFNMLWNKFGIYLMAISVIFALLITIINTVCIKKILLPRNNPMK